MKLLVVPLNSYRLSDESKPRDGS